MDKDSFDASAGPVTPLGIDHLVVNVRDLEESHRFWTEILGFEQVGELEPTPQRPNPPKMRFYSGRRSNRLHHHDLALMENRDLPPPPDSWTLTGMPMAINHVAIRMPDRESWLAQLAFLQTRGVAFERRVDHGMTHSVYIRDPNGYGVEILYELPREIWQNDINAALNYVRNRPVEGEAALEDSADEAPVFGASGRD